MRSCMIGVLLTGLLLAIVSSTGAQASGWGPCGVVRVHGSDKIVRLKIDRYIFGVSCETARSVVRRAWRLPKPTSKSVLPPQGWRCSVRDRDAGGFCGRSGASTWVLTARNAALEGQTTYVPVG
jgi:hypothetical protein